MDVIITGRHCSVSDDIKDEVTKRLKSIEKLRDRIIRVEVEFTVNTSIGNPDQSVEAQITLRSKGPVVRAEAFADGKLTAFDRAYEKLTNQLRRAADRRKKRRGLRTLAPIGAVEVETAPVEQEPVKIEEVEAPVTKNVAGIEVTGEGPFVVREKTFDSVPLTLAQALDEMELVGHDFFLYVDAETNQPSVVYRRKAYDYGVIHLNLS